MIAHSQLAPLPLELPFRTVSKTIGQGAYACIKKAAPPNAPAPIFAVKFIHKDYAVRHGGLTRKQLDLEISLHRFLGSHAHIVQFFDAGEDQNWRWIAMELAEGGDLFDKIESDVGVGEDIAHLYFLQLLSAVRYMHSKGIGHRDIKPENILLSAGGNLKIADFGLAVLFEYNGSKKLCSTSCGSPPYTAPEVVTCDHRMKKKLDQGYQGNLVDIWSCAVVLFVLLVGNTPWDEPLDRSYEFAQYVNSSGTPDDELWHKLPHPTISLLRGMMAIDPSQRMTLVEIQNHPWVNRQNRHLNLGGTLDDPIEVATQMFENLKVDFSADLNSHTEQVNANRDAMDLDDSSPHATSKRAQSKGASNEIMFDWETPSQQNTMSALHSPEEVVLSQKELDEHLAEDPSCSQFSSIPKVPLTRTQFARQFRDILPSQALTRFFSFWPLPELRASLLRCLVRLDAATDESDQRIPSDASSPQANIKIRANDSRHCALTGNIMMDNLRGVEGNVVEVTFVKAKGDPIEWRRLFKKVVIGCKDAVYRPEEVTPLLSQGQTS